LQAGFSWQKASDATAVEAPPAPFNAESIAANDRYEQLSGGFIPPLSQLKLLSLGGGHTNTFLRACKGKCLSAVPKLADSSGRFNPEELSVGRAAFAEAMRDGLRWYVIHWQCPAVWPDLVHFVQAALNTHAKNEQSEVEVMLEMHGMMKQAVDSGRQADWAEIEEAACFSLPPCSSYIKSLSAFVRDNAGGAEGTLLHELSQFHKAFGCGQQGATRKLGADFMGKLVSLNFGLGVRFPYLLNAAISANLNSGKVVDGICRLLQQPQLSALTTKANRSMVESAEQLMQDTRKLCSVMNVDQAIRCTAIGRCDVRCVLLITKKLKDVEKTPFLSIGAIAEAVPGVCKQ